MTLPVAIETNLPAGNACIIASRYSADTVEIEFMPSPVGGPEAMWFCFRIVPDAATPPATIRCRLLLPDNLLGGDSKGTGLLPVYKTASQDWTRVPAVALEQRADGRPICHWDLPGNQGAVEVALCYAYGIAELEQLLRSTTLDCDLIGLSDRDRPLLRLSNGPGAPASVRPGIYCVARQHAGETPGSWLLDGFLRAIAAAGAGAPLVWAVPFVDVDGVTDGNYGKDRFPWDYNRAWGSKLYSAELRPNLGSHPMRHEVRCIQTDMLHWRTRCQPLLVLDFHAPVLHEAKGIYCYVRDVDASGCPDPQHQPWTTAFATALGSTFADPRFVHHGRYQSRWNTARINDFADAIQVPSFTIETPYARAREHIFSRETYQEAGARIASAILNHNGPQQGFGSDTAQAATAQS